MDDDQDITEVIADAFSDVELRLFASFIQELKNSGRPQAEIDRWQNSFDEYMRVDQEVVAQFGLRHTIAEVRRRIPHNEWLELMRSSIPSAPATSFHISEPLLERLQEKLEKKRKGTNVN